MFDICARTYRAEKIGTREGDRNKTVRNCMHYTKEGISPNLSRDTIDDLLLISSFFQKSHLPTATVGILFRFLSFLFRFLLQRLYTLSAELLTWQPQE